MGPRDGEEAQERQEQVEVGERDGERDAFFSGLGGSGWALGDAAVVAAPARAGVATWWRGLRDRARDLLDQAGVRVDYDRPAQTQSAAAATFLQLESDWEAAYLLTLQAAWMADNSKPNSLEASMAKAKAGRTGTDVTNKVVELTGTLGYSERLLVEKWARDSKILDIFEGTQQIQQLIIARRVLGKSSAELK